MFGNRIKISIGFVVLLAVLFYLDEGLGMLGPALLACILHELGHFIAIRAVGGRVLRLELSSVGAALVLDGQISLNYTKEFIIALAGPLSSFLCAWLAMRGRWYLLAGLSLGQGLFNLLPIQPLDGGRALYALLCDWKDNDWVDRGLTGISSIVVGFLLGSGLIILRKYGNLTLAITSFWLLGGILKQRWNSWKEKQTVLTRKPIS